MDLDQERKFRDAAIAWLDQRRHRGQDRLSYRELADYRYRGERIPLIDSRRGIRKPAGFQSALSIRTTYTSPGEPRPYDDRVSGDGMLHYKYRGDDPNHHENRAIRAAMNLQLPLMWFVGVASGVYEARYPVWVRQDRPKALEFLLELPR